jgi:replication factor C small subunit
MQNAICFPQPLSEKYRPVKIADFIGLETPKKIMTKLAANPYQSDWIFYGPSGLGKTTMALALALEMPAELHHIPSQNCTAAEIERITRICNFVPMAGCKMHIVLVDEADRMTEGAQIALLSKLDSTAHPPNTIFIFTCNSKDGLEKRFLSRCRPVDFSSYGIAKEAADLLRRIWKSEANDAPEPKFERIVKDSCNNVRDALMNLEVELMAA